MKKSLRTSAKTNQAPFYKVKQPPRKPFSREKLPYNPVFVPGDVVHNF
jgi:hypothetical protein